MAGSTLFSHAINSITNFRKTDPKPIIDHYSTKSAGGDCNADLPLKHSRLEIIPETVEEDEDESLALLPAKSPQEMVKVAQFARPPLSHEDPLDGFTFTKPKIPQMNFSRNSAQNSSMTADPDSLKNLPSAKDTKPRNSSAASPELTESTLSANILRNTIINTQKDVNPEPPAITGPTPNEESQAPNLFVENSSIARQANTLSGANAAASPNMQFQVPKAVDQMTPKITQNAILPTSGAPMSGPTYQQLRAPQMKVTKSPRKTQMLSESKLQHILQPVDLKPSLNDEDLLKTLVFRHRREQQKKEALIAAQNAKDLELEDLRDVSKDLYQQLQHAHEQNQVKEMELSRFHSAIPHWEEKIQNLKEHVKILTDDHQELRKGADDLQKRHESTQIDKTALNTAFKEVRETMDHNYSRTKKVLREAKHEMQMLEQTVNNQEVRLQEDGDLLDAERDRSHRLEHEMAEISKSHQEMARLFIGHRNEVADKLNDLLEKTEIAKTVNLPNAWDDLKPLLDQCLQMLRNIQEVETVKPQDLHKLDTSVRTYAQDLTQSVQSCGRASDLTREAQKKFSLDLQQQLHELTSNIRAEKMLNEQLMDVREMRATVRERLQATESALVEARQRAIVLENESQRYVQRIHELEVEVCRVSSRETESPQLISQVQELNVRNKELHEQVATSHREANGVSEQLQEKIEEASKLEANVKDLQSQLNDALIESTTFEDQKVANDCKAAEQLDLLRKQLSRSATLERARIEGDYLNQVKQLAQQKSTVEEKAEQWKRQLSRLQKEKEEIDNVAKERLQLLNEIKVERMHDGENIEILQTRIVALELRVEEETQCLQKSQEELRAATANLEINEAEILKLTATSVLRINANAGPTDADHSGKPKRKLNRANTQSKVVVLDSQPGLDNSIFGSHAQNQARGTSPISFLDDLSELFPSTPVQGSQVLDVSQNTQSSVSDPRNTHNKHLTFAAGTLGGENPEQMYRTVDQLTEGKSQSTPLKALSKSRKPGGHNLILSQSHQSDTLVRPSEPVFRQPPTKVTKSNKRTASAAGLDKKTSQVRSSGSTSIRGLGPVIPDSQSPNGSQVVVGRGGKFPKVKARKPSKDDKYTVRFEQELH